MIVIFDILVYTFFHWKKRISSTWEEHNCGIIIRDINETKAKIFHTLYTLIHSQAMARVYSGGEKRIFDLRTRQGGGTEKRKSGRRDDTREMGERGGGLYIETAEDEGRRGGWESVLNTCFSYRVHFEAWSAIPSLWHHHPGFCSSQKHRQHREYTLTYTHAHTHTRARAVLDLFRSSIILFYFLVRHCLARSYLLIYRPPLPQRRFIFIYEPMPSIPFYLSSFFFILFVFYSSLALILSESLSTYRVTRHMQLPFRIESKEEFIFLWIYFYRFFLPFFFLLEYKSWKS